MSNGDLKGSKVETHAFTAETVYKALNELGAMAQGVFEHQVAINEKLIDNPTGGDDAEKKPEVETPVHSSHFPAFVDMAREIGERLSHTKQLQEYLLTHM